MASDFFGDVDAISDPWRDDPVYDTDEESVSDDPEEQDEDDDVEEGVSDLDDSECICGYCKFDEDPGIARKCCKEAVCLTKNPSGAVCHTKTFSIHCCV